MALYLPIRTTGAFTGIGAVYADRFSLVVHDLRKEWPTNVEN
jgi:hypothetical protein